MGSTLLLGNNLLIKTNDFQLLLEEKARIQHCNGGKTFIIQFHPKSFCKSNLKIKF
jgi:hypothetical protein